MTHFTKTLLLVLVAGASACSSDIQDEQLPTNDPGGNTTTGGGEGTTFDHDNGGKSPWEVLADQQAMGPARYTAAMHGCRKMLYSTVGNVIASRGVAVPGTGATSAGQLYATGANSMGAPSYAARVRENSTQTTAGMSRLFDIFSSASTEIIAKFPTVAACQVAGTAPPLFDAGGTQCNRQAFTCLMGLPMSDAQFDICNKTIAGAKNAAGAYDQPTGQRLAIAVVLSAAHTCE
jgi:hypothetical protein